jgi:hypothetical protein
LVSRLGRGRPHASTSGDVATAAMSQPPLVEVRAASRLNQRRCRNRGDVATAAG